MQDVEYEKMYGVEERHWWYRTLHELILATLRANIPGNLRLFDAGCGTGRLLQLAKPLGEVVGCDRSPHALARCRSRGVEAFNADLNALTLEPGAYNAITAIDVLYHGWIADEVAVLRRLREALEPGGLLILDDPAYEWLRGHHDRAVMTRHRYTLATRRHLLEQAGFRVERATYRNAILFPTIAAHRLLRRWSGRKGETSDVWMPSDPLNALCLAVGRLENRWLNRANLPFGSSVFAVARRLS